MQVFTEDQMINYARALIWGMEEARRGTGGMFKRGDVVKLNADFKSMSLAEMLYEELIRKGFHVAFDVGSTPKMEKNFFDFADDDQLQFLPSWRKLLCENLNGSIGIYAPESLTHLKDCDQEKLAMRQMSFKPIKDIIYNEREPAGLFGWTLGYYPTTALAKQAGMSLREYADEVAKACLLNEHNAAEAWTDLKKRAEEIKLWLNKITEEIDYFLVKTDNMRLKVGPGEKRRWLGVSGHNIPSFELFCSPDWRTVEGTYYANEMSLKSGNLVQGVRLKIEKGRVVEARAEKGEECLLKQIDMDEGARQIGEFSLTDKRFSTITKFMASTLFDENVGGKNGNCHIAVGSAYVDSYTGDVSKLTKKDKAKFGFNDSAQHWDLINTEQKEVVAWLKDGTERIIYQDGQFCI